MLAAFIVFGRLEVNPVRVAAMFTDLPGVAPAGRDNPGLEDEIPLGFGEARYYVEKELSREGEECEVFCRVFWAARSRCMRRGI